MPFRPLALIAAATTIPPTAAGCSSGSPSRSTAAGSASAGSASGGSAMAGSAARAATLSWSSCPSEGAQAQCTSVQVPLNYADPGGRKISLALSRIPATAPRSQQQGVLLVDPGGPGGSGLSLASFVAQGAGGGSGSTRAAPAAAASAWPRSWRKG